MKGYFISQPDQMKKPRRIRAIAKKIIAGEWLNAHERAIAAEILEEKEKQMV